MYLVRVEFMVRAGGAGEFEAASTRLGEMRKGHPGYLGQAFLHSYSNPSKYAVTSRYANVEAAWAFNRSDVLANYVKSITPGLFAITQQQGYEGVFEVDAEGANAGTSTCEVLADWTLNPGPGVVAAFERTRRALFELRKTHCKGFASSRLRRAGGTPGKYLIFSMFDTADNARAANTVPEIQAFQAAHPYTLYASTPPAIEAYHVIHRIAG